MADRRIAVGLTGQFGAGCSTVAKFLEEIGFRNYTLSNYVEASLQSRLGAMEYQKLTRKQRRQALQDEGNRLREPDAAYLAKEVLSDIEKDKSADQDIVVDSIRNHAEVNHLRDSLPRFYLMTLDASPAIRWERKQNDYENDTTQFGKDDLRDKGDDEPPHGQHTEACVYAADVVIDNEKQIGYRQDWDLFFYRVRQFIDLMRSPGYRNPTYKELYMHIAYAISLKSSCSKRQVGAIIVSPRKE